MNRKPHWRFEKDFTKLTDSRLQILALRAFPSSPRQLAIRAELNKRLAQRREFDAELARLDKKFAPRIEMIRQSTKLTGEEMNMRIG